jgi:DNA-binding CsgD family transcriptional regulator
VGDEDARDERRRAVRAIASVDARLAAGDLVIEGVITDIALGGVFFAARVVIEVGERGRLLLDDLDVGVQVMWLRGNAHLAGPGMGLAFDDDAALLETVKAGAKGYLLKDVSLEQLTAAIRDVAAGGTVIRPVVTERVLRGLEHVRRDFDALSPPDPLTRREIEILRLMAGGYSNREIADALGTAEGTVKNHASSILSKLGVRDRTQAVVVAYESGLVTPRARELV